MSPRHLRRHLPLIFALLAMIGIAIAYVLAMSIAQSWQAKHLRVVDLIPARCIDVLIIVWCLWVGTSIGSFLNVVAWRMPRGESINGRSICPRCRVQLRALDNFPVLGWLALGGRCRTCRLPISARYPIVESLVGLSITMVASGELFQWSLPYQVAERPRGLFWDHMIDTGVLITLAYHIVALSVAWAMGLIRIDGNRLPTKLVSFALVSTILPMLVYPRLMVVPWQMDGPANWRPDQQYLDAIVRVITALATAIFLARSMTQSLCPTADPKLDPLGKGTARLIDLIMILAIPILVVGWQASVAVVVIASLVAIALRRWLAQVDGLGRLAIGMPVAMTVQLTVWKWLHEAAYWPSEGSSPWVILAWAAAAMTLPMMLRDRPDSERQTAMVE